MLTLVRKLGHPQTHAVATSAKEPDVSHSPKLNESSTGGENTQSSVESDPSNGQSTALDSDSAQQHIDLKACTDVKYEKRGGVHGVVVQQHDNDQTWTPVCGKRRKRIPLSEAQSENSTPLPSSTTE